MILKIITEPNPILHQASKELTKAEILNPNTQQLIQDMVVAMHAGEGAGIAAPQVEKLARICVIAKNFTEKKMADLVLINPTWKRASILKAWDDEGCLSVPGVHGQVKRYKKIKVKALDINAQPLKFTAGDFFARVIQHEVDHLRGVLFIEKARAIHEIEPIKNNLPPPGQI